MGLIVEPVAALRRLRLQFQCPAVPGVIHGGVAEWTKAPVLKTGIR